MGEPSDAALPILWITAGVETRKDYDRVINDKVKNAVRKLAQERTPDALENDGILRRIAADNGQARVESSDKFLFQALAG